MDLKTTDSKANRKRITFWSRPGIILSSSLIVIIGAALSLMILNQSGERINVSGYQVVYLSNGQAYFGKLQNTTGEYLVVKDPYTTTNVASDKDNEAGQTTLNRVEDQAYGPEGVISLKSTQVMFWQNLKDDSKVFQAIKNSQK